MENNETHSITMTLREWAIITQMLVTATAGQTGDLRARAAEIALKLVQQTL